MKFFPTFGLVAAVAVSAAPAFAKNYECKLKMGRSGGNWMGPTVYVNYDEANGTAMIIDGIINKYVGKPVPTSSITDNAKRTSFRYRLDTIGGTSTGRSGVAYANHVYSLTIKKPSLSAVITMKPLGYQNTFRDTGTCKVTK
ncbi:hypothetical protein [Aliiroseovarius sp. S253]|uniref:hypothetical protein n=1 Tax=Aliiroseovarius sp. S253 TaxID=3415133 RepID=UPI003C79CC8D